ncbi:hypothetical protein AX17_004279 [Amanita inopinata Kibby_2008]|nr:hypothetical protein AX17_004279 [Amanita inopinata Kibby_2008]
MSKIQDLNIQGTVVTPSSPSYQQAIARFSATSVLHPAYVAYPQDPSDISAILQFARSQQPPLKIAVKGGGFHTSTSSSCEGGIVIDLGRFNTIKVSEDKKTVSVGGGATWGEVYAEIEKHDIVVVGGNMSRVGVGGLLTCGGYSFLSGTHGLAIDSLLEATVVLADGRVVMCNTNKEPDLFWAIRGAGGHFGVVVEFILNAYPAHGTALFGALVYPPSELPVLLNNLRAFLSTQTQDRRIILGFARGPPDFQPGLLILPYIEGSAQSAEQILLPFCTSAKPVFRETSLAPTFNVIAQTNGTRMANVPPRTMLGAALFGDLWDDVVTHVFEEWVAFTEVEERRESTVLFEFDSRDKIAAVKPDATAFAARDPHYFAVVTCHHTSADMDSVARGWISKITSYIRKSNTEKTGISLPTPANIALGDEDIRDVYGANFGRLKRLKARYDPHKVWSQGWVIEPEFD